MKRILFVCLGNICRSSAAQTIMQRLVDEAGLSAEFEIDSAGLISYHEGEPADRRMRSHASRRGLRITHLSRPIRTTDFRHFDMIIGMDDSNMSQLHRLSPDLDTDAKLHRMTDYCLNMVADHVPDPYYGGDSDFELALDLLEDACQGLLTAISSGMSPCPTAPRQRNNS